MKAKEIGRKTIKCVNSAVNIIVLTIVLLLLAYAVYALWDSKQIHEAADKSHYEVYKPTEANEGKSFRELQDINPDVFAWLTVYGTNIDYPVTQGDNNMKYVNTNAEGAYSISGSIFLDCDNSNDFSDFNSILYGHHMEKEKMFGQIGDFSDKAVFDAHKYGNLYYGRKDHGVEFFAFIHTDAYDNLVFTPNVKGADRQVYLDYMLEKALYKRDIGITAEDRIVLLSTCSSSSTNGRDILAGRITDTVYEDSWTGAGSGNGEYWAMTGQGSGITKTIKTLTLLLILILAALIVLIVRKIRQKQKYNESKNRGENDV